jgi:glycosyltransferase involved in cell wall biosynthesis
MVNRELLVELIKHPEFDIRIIRFEPDQFLPESSSKYSSLKNLSQSPPHEHPHLQIRHHWPPNFTKPVTGKLAVIFPWEYGSLPITWRDQMKQHADEIWVYSSYLKKCYERSGLPPEMIHIVPPGIDVDLFNPDAPELPFFAELKSDRFCFLYNGGVTLRKGTDILVNAYLNAFTANDNVCLIIKDSFSYGKELAAKIQSLSSRTDIAKIHYILQNFKHEELPSLYRSCDCYVHPYRAEGFGLPVAEALSCGKPVITTMHGSTSDFVDSQSGFLINSTTEFMKQRSVSGLDTVDLPWWSKPDMKHLQFLMRYSVEHYSEAQQLAIAGRQNIQKHFNTTAAADNAAVRIHSLLSADSSTLASTGTGNASLK